MQRALLDGGRIGNRSGTVAAKVRFLGTGGSKRSPCRRPPKEGAVEVSERVRERIEWSEGKNRAVPAAGE